MEKYRKKPVVIDAVQLTMANRQAVSTIIAAAGYSLFQVPYNLAAGGVTGIGTASAIGASPATGNGSQLDQAAFLRLMTAQVAAQDPFKPLDQSQMLAQLAQFSQVAGTAEMNVSPP